ncbi:hypothetical protein Pyn_36177 [Prunus yedoensis var. nudiflora]|uniref:Uncharacterized protein n=1 Tax=Prunus yedoensis var. nudiflora TaxID=2094558 RepID=A0A314UEW1_PRUYE|nr:hypothetical protein Pyn_36177 [Prunus yedoensis var. nudiflora]
MISDRFLMPGRTYHSNRHKDQKLRAPGSAFLDQSDSPPPPSSSSCLTLIFFARNHHLPFANHSLFPDLV